MKESMYGEDEYGTLSDYQPMYVTDENYIGIPIV